MAFTFPRKPIALCRKASQVPLWSPLRGTERARDQTEGLWRADIVGGQDTCKYTGLHFLRTKAWEILPLN
jgi:hypothetical protein